MTKKSCKYCGIVPFNHVCPVLKKEQHDRDIKREDKKVYWSTKWRKLRAEVAEEQDYICLWSLYVDGVIRQVDRCHHIIELIEDESKAYDRDNLISLDRDIHDYVHELYKIDRVTKAKTQQLLRECNELWNSGVKLEGLGTLKGRVNKIES